MRRVRNVTLARDDDDEEAATHARANLPQAQQHEIQEVIDEGAIATEEDRPLLVTSVGMTQTEFDLLSEFLRVYDHARSHFIFEICEPGVKRFLNAHRIRFEEEEDARMLERIQNNPSRQNAE